DSRSEILRLTVASGVPSLREAADRLPASTTARRTDIASRRSITPLSKFRKGLSRSYGMRSLFATTYVLPASQCPSRRCDETAGALGINNHLRFGCSGKDAAVRPSSCLRVA